MTDRSPRPEDELSRLIASIEVPAPSELRLRVKAMADEASARPAPAARNPFALRLGAATALAVLIVALIIVLTSSGGQSGLGVQRTAAFALAGATTAAPREDPSARSELAVDVEGVSFPYWGERFGWKSSGSRTDSYDGRTVTTVFYSDSSGRQVGYAIVARRPAPSAGTGAVHWVGRTAYHLSSLGGAGVVSWIRDGLLCVVAGRGVPSRTLLALASWQERASTS